MFPVFLFNNLALYLYQVALVMRDFLLKFVQLIEIRRATSRDNRIEYQKCNLI